MQMNSPNIHIPKFIQAKSLLGLERRIKELTLKSGKQFHFFDFFQDQDKNYIAVYRDEIEIQTEITNKLKGE